MQKSDAKRLTELCNDQSIWDGIRDAMPYPYTEKDACNFIDICLKENPKTTFGIVYHNELVGCIGFELQSDLFRHSAEVGYWVERSYRGMGIATEALQQITNYGFSRLHLFQIFAGVADYNKASQRVLEKAGYKPRGILKKSIVKNDKVYDEFRYALICDEAKSGELPSNHQVAF